MMKFSGSIICINEKNYLILGLQREQQDQAKRVGLSPWRRSQEVAEQGPEGGDGIKAKPGEQKKGPD